jgi:type II secretory pathway component PulM
VSGCERIFLYANKKRDTTSLQFYTQLNTQLKANCRHEAHRSFIIIMRWALHNRERTALLWLILQVVHGARYLLIIKYTEKYRLSRKRLHRTFQHKMLWSVWNVYHEISNPASPAKQWKSDGIEHHPVTNCAFSSSTRQFNYKSERSVTFAIVNSSFSREPITQHKTVQARIMYASS